MFFFTGLSRNASEVAAEQIKNTVKKNKELKDMQNMVDDAINILNGKQEDYNDFGKLLHETWRIKKSLTDIVSMPAIDKIYDTALRAGAIGGKLCGAGGGGFLMFFAPPEAQAVIREKFKKKCVFLFLWKIKKMINQQVLSTRQEL